MGQFVDDLQNDLQRIKEQLAAVEEEKSRVLDELGEMKRVSNAANMRLSEVLSEQNQTENSSVMENSLVTELEQVSVLSAQKRDQAWQLELEAVQKQHALDVEALTHDLVEIRKKLIETTEEKDAACKLAEEARYIARANVRKTLDLSAELSLVKEELDDSSEDLEIREKDIENLKLELEKMRQRETEVAEKTAIFEKMVWELNNTKELESKTRDLLSESHLRIQMLESELDKTKESERILTDSLLCKMKELENTKETLEESKVEVNSLEKKVEYMEDLLAETNRELDISHQNLEKAKFDADSMREKVGTLRSKLHLVKEDLARAHEGEELDSTKATSLIQEVRVLRNELKAATEAEENSKKAMDEIALVMIEVSRENKEIKEHLCSNQIELENAREEAECLKKMLKSTEEKFEELLDEARKETKQYKDESERLKLEADDSILSWNDKELGFVNCIKRAEEESAALKQENNKLIDSSKAAEKQAKIAREENCKLRDILKQAINEASAAKEVAEIARAENVQLKDSLFDKEKMLQVLVQENEHLRLNEAAAFENIKELKRLLSTASKMDTMTEDTHVGGTVEEQHSITKEQKSILKESSSSKKLPEVLSLKLEEVKVPQGYEEEVEDSEEDLLKGSIFDVADSPNAPPPKNHSHRKTPSLAFSDDDKHVGEVIKEQNSAVKKQNSILKEHSFSKRVADVLRLKLEEVKIPHGHKEEIEDPEKAEMLKGSIFDVADSPLAPSSTNDNHHQLHRLPSPAFTDEGESLNFEEFDMLDGSQLDDDNDRSSQRKKKALLRRFGDLIRKTSFHRKEPSIG